MAIDPGVLNYVTQNAGLFRGVANNNYGPNVSPVGGQNTQVGQFSFGGQNYFYSPSQWGAGGGGSATLGNDAASGLGGTQVTLPGYTTYSTGGSSGAELPVNNPAQTGYVFSSNPSASLAPGTYNPGIGYTPGTGGGLIGNGANAIFDKSQAALIAAAAGGAFLGPALAGGAGGASAAASDAGMLGINAAGAGGFGAGAFAAPNILTSAGLTAAGATDDWLAAAGAAGGAAGSDAGMLGVNSGGQGGFGADAGTPFGAGAANGSAAGPYGDGSLGYQMPGAAAAAGGATGGIGAGAFSLSSLFDGLFGSSSGLGFGGGGKFGTVSNLLGLGSTAYGLYESDQMRKAAKDAAAKSDPFGPWRNQYATQLSALESNPSSVMNDPAYQTSVQAVRRAMAKSGYTMSGNEMIGLQKNYGDYVTNKENQLAGLAGAGIQGNPGLNLVGNAQANQLSSQSLANLGLLAYRNGM